MLLFDRERVRLAQAVYLAGLSRLRFQRLLVSRGVLVYYTVPEFEADLQALRELGRLDRGR